MRALLLTQWYPPEPGPARVPAVIARGLAIHGIVPTVLTGFPNYPTGILQDGWRIRLVQDGFFDDIRTIRVPLIPSHGKGMLGRLLNYGTFGLSAAIAYPLLRVSGKLDRPDVLWVSYSPVTVGLSQLMAQLVDRVPVVLWIGDLWPDTLDVAGIDGASKINQFTSPILHWWCNFLYRKASAVIVISPGVSRVLESRGVPKEKIHYIPVAPDTAIFHTADAEREKWDLPENRRILIYAGAMGTAQELTTLIQAAGNAGSDSPLIVIAGSGTSEHHLREQANRLKAPIKFLGRIPEAEMASLLASGDAAYIGLAAAPLSKITMPSKTQSILASGRPIICCADGDVADLIKSTNSGWTVSAGDVGALEEVLRKFNSVDEIELVRKASNASAAYNTNFQETVISEKYKETFRKIIVKEKSIPGPHSEITASRGFHKKDAEELAKLHQEAFPNFFLSSLGVPFLRRFYRGFALDPSGVSVVYRKQGKIVGVAVGTTQPEGFYSRLLKRDFLGLGIAAARAASRNPKSTIRLFRGFFYRGGEANETGQGLLSSICISPSERGHGLGHTLIEDFVNAMKDRGARSVVLSTDADNNESVNRLYNRTGWKLKMQDVSPEGRRMNYYVMHF